MKIKDSLGERIFDKINIIFMILLCVTIIFPFAQQLVISISKPEEISKLGLHLFTANPTLDAYKRIFLTNTLVNAFGLTIFKTVVGTTLSVLISCMLAYPLSKRWLVGQKFWMGLVVFTMFFSGGMIPTYILVRGLHLTNTIGALILPGLCTAWNIIIIRNFFSSLPEELEESSKIDGANDLIIFWKIIMPLSKPIIATITLWTLVGHWNAWFDAMIYIRKPSMKVLQIVLRETINDASNISGDAISQELGLSGSQYTSESIKAATLLVVTFPILCVYPFLQKYFVKGIMIGSVKG